MKLREEEIEGEVRILTPEEKAEILKEALAYKEPTNS